MTTNKAQSQVDQTRAELLKIEEDQRARKADIDAAESELRRALVVARTGKGTSAKDAQAEVDRIAGALAKLRTDDTSDSIVIEELSDRLRAEEGALHREQWRGRCQKVRELIQRRLKSEKEKEHSLLDITTELRERLFELRRLDGEIYTAAAELKHPRLKELMGRLSGAGERPAEIVVARLQPLIESRLNSGYLSMLSKADPGAGSCAEELLRLLDEIAETAPGEDRRLSPPEVARLLTEAKPAAAVAPVAGAPASKDFLKDLPSTRAMGTKPVGGSITG